MNMLSFTHSHASSRATVGLDTSMFMDISHDFESAEDGVVRWVASQSPNPALQALMKEAERDKKTRPSTPAHESTSWTYPLTSTASSAPSSTAVAPSWHHNSIDASHLAPGSRSTSASFLGPRASEPSVSMRPKPLSAAQRKPFAASTSSMYQPPRDSARPRSSSHSIPLSDPSDIKFVHKEGPEETTFIDLLKDTFRQVDEHSEKKRRAAVRKKEKEREHSLGRGVIGDRMGLDTRSTGARPLTKTSSASAICPMASTTRALEKISNASMSDFRPESRGRVMTKTSSLGAPGVDLVSGKFLPTLLSSPDPSCDLKLAPASLSLTGPPSTPDASYPTIYKPRIPESKPNDGESPMQDVIDLTETDTEWEKFTSSSTVGGESTTYMDVDDDDSEVGMDVSFFGAEHPLQPHVAAPKPKSRPSQTRPPAPLQRARTGPPPLGMRRVPQLQPSQCGASQVPKSLTVSRFKPPLRANAGGAMNKNGSGTKPATTPGSGPVSRGVSARAPVAKTTAREGRDADSSFDVSFGVDADVLEEAMKAYD